MFRKLSSDAHGIENRLVRFKTINKFTLLSEYFLQRERNTSNRANFNAQAPVAADNFTMEANSFPPLPGAAVSTMAFNRFCSSWNSLFFSFQ